MMKDADDAGNYRSLKTIALKQIDKNPNDPFALSMLAKAYLEEQKPDSAVIFYDRAYKIKPDKNSLSGLVNSTVIFGDTLLKKGLVIQARDTYQSAVDLDSSHFAAHCRLGLVYKNLGHFDEAQLFYRKALRLNIAADSLQKILDFLDASHVQSNLLMNRGIDLLKQKKYKEAKETLEKAVTAKPDNEPAKYHSYLANGLFYYKRGSVGRLWDAIENFGLAGALRPDEAEPHFYMAEAYIKKDDKDFKNTIHEYEEVIRLAPESHLAKEAQKRIVKLKAREKLLKDFWKK
jgi:tetratricopeptide (TPR) repeat protein